MTVPRRKSNKDPQVRPGPPLSIVYRDIGQLQTDPQNPRQHSRRQIRQIARSIEAFGFNVPFLIDRRSRLVAGHGRLEACRLLGLQQVPTISLDHLSETQVRAFLIADNRLSETATWNERLLAEQLKGLSEVELNFSLEATGFEVGEIKMMIDGLSSGIDGDDQGDVLPVMENVACVTRGGDLWLLGNHRICCGNAFNARNYSALLEEHRAAIVFTEPRLSISTTKVSSGLDALQERTSSRESEPELTALLSQLFTLLLSNSLAGSLHYVFSDWHQMLETLTAGRVVYHDLKNVCVWVKNNLGSALMYRNQFEFVCVFASLPGNGASNHRPQSRHRSDVWQYPRRTPRSTEVGLNLDASHLSVKPVDLVADALIDGSVRGEVVLDPFLGYGSTLIAAERTGRVCYGMELEPRWVDAAIRRWQAYTGQSAIHKESGQTFSSREAHDAHTGKQ